MRNRIKQVLIGRPLFHAFFMAILRTMPWFLLALFIVGFVIIALLWFLGVPDPVHEATQAVSPWILCTVIVLIALVQTIPWTIPWFLFLAVQFVGFGVISVILYLFEVVREPSYDGTNVLVLRRT